jgi:large subunit ribosomal protein L1
VAFKSDDTGNIHQLIGKISWDEAKLKENVNAFMEAVMRAKPSSAKGEYVKKVAICSTMGPGVRVDI